MSWMDEKSSDHLVKRVRTHVYESSMNGAGSSSNSTFIYHRGISIPPFPVPCDPQKVQQEATENPLLLPREAVSRRSHKSFRGDENGSVQGKWRKKKMMTMVMAEADEESAVTSKAGRGSQDAANRFEELKNQGSGFIIRVCSSCSTTKTPLWRSGPQGPKSLCNACGIRRRRERGAAMAPAEAAAAASSSDGRSGRKEEKPTASRETFLLPFKKRCRHMADGGGAARRNLGFDDATSLSLSNSSSSSSSSSSSF